MAGFIKCIRNHVAQIRMQPVAVVVHGKTYVLRPRIDSDDRVLVIVHRQSLAKDVARRHNVKCYLDIPTPKLSGNKMVVCINSLHRLNRTDFALVVVEESEQLLRGLARLTGKHHTNINHDMFRECVSRARQVVALDAQMSNLTLDSLEYIRQQERFNIWSNTFAQTKLLRWHEAKAPLIAAFNEAVAARSQGAGKPVALVANTKRLVEEQYERLKKNHPHLRCALIPSRTDRG